MGLEAVELEIEDADIERVEAVVDGDVISLLDILEGTEEPVIIQEHAEETRDGILEH